MYWDVVEVKPEPDYGLFVRFKDGLAGRVRLSREELTGALAPDAMYAQIASRRPGEQQAEPVRSHG